MAQVKPILYQNGTQTRRVWSKMTVEIPTTAWLEVLDEMDGSHQMESQ
jgi:hypothetical protein